MPLTPEEVAEINRQINEQLNEPLTPRKRGVELPDPRAPNPTAKPEVESVDLEEKQP